MNGIERDLRWFNAVHQTNNNIQRLPWYLDNSAHLDTVTYSIYKSFRSSVYNLLFV